MPRSVAEAPSFAMLCCASSIPSPGLNLPVKASCELICTDRFDPGDRMEKAKRSVAMLRASATEQGIIEYLEDDAFVSSLEAGVPKATTADAVGGRCLQVRHPREEARDFLAELSYGIPLRLMLLREDVVLADSVRRCGFWHVRLERRDKCVVLEVRGVMIGVKRLKRV